MSHVREEHEGLLRAFEGQTQALRRNQYQLFHRHAGRSLLAGGTVTDEKIKLMAECWNRVGRKTKEHGVKLTCHHEFYCGLHTREEVDKFYAWTDPEYVGLFLTLRSTSSRALTPPICT